MFCKLCKQEKPKGQEDGHCGVDLAKLLSLLTEMKREVDRADHLVGMACSPAQYKISDNEVKSFVSILEKSNAWRPTNGHYIFEPLVVFKADLGVKFDGGGKKVSNANILLATKRLLGCRMCVLIQKASTIIELEKIDHPSICEECIETYSDVAWFCECGCGG